MIENRAHDLVARANQLGQGEHDDLLGLDATLRDVVARPSLDLLLALDRQARRALHDIPEDRLRAMLDELLPDSLRVPTAAIFSFHANGYLREIAVDALTGADVQLGFPYLVMRSNDWVPVIRSRVREVLAERIVALPASLLFDNFALLQRMRKWKRADHTQVLRAVDRVLTSPAAAASRWQALQHPNRQVRHAAIELSFRSDPHLVPELVDYVLESRDRSLRKASVRLLNRLGQDQRGPISTCFLFDTDGDIRTWAQRTTPHEDLGARYRNEIDKGTRLRAALYGIGEHGRATDVHIVLQFVEHPHTRVRRAALYALAHLDMDANVKLFVDMLETQRMGVARDAANWLTRFPHLIGPHRSALHSLQKATDVERAGFADTVLQAADQYAERWL